MVLINSVYTTLLFAFETNKKSTYTQCRSTEYLVSIAIKLSTVKINYTPVLIMQLLWCVSPSDLIRANKHPHNFLSSCCCLLLILINVLNHLYASINDSKSRTQTQNCHAPLLRLKFRLLGSSRLLYFQISKV